MAEDENAPATKKDLAELEARMDARLDAKLDGKLSQLEERLSEQMRDMQTEILKAFLPWQESVQVQQARG
jgi:hypothetical protein